MASATTAQTTQLPLWVPGHCYQWARGVLLVDKLDLENKQQNKPSHWDKNEKNVSFIFVKSGTPAVLWPSAKGKKLATMTMINNKHCNTGTSTWEQTQSDTRQKSLVSWQFFSAAYGLQQYLFQFPTAKSSPTSICNRCRKTSALHLKRLELQLDHASHIEGSDLR